MKLTDTGTIPEPRFEIDNEETSRKTFTADIITDTKTDLHCLAYRDNIYDSNDITRLVDVARKPLIDKKI
ncbi:hypothetical protein GCM10011573_11820 [Enterococcus wangshanyuanii]|uniref:Transposase n=1 Tax=Enterococcus wangshanyuanii TaxID=2005703 RepID=A0ABQ1NSF4_9ENTE|nr:hypothetical protein GCM10011573_11820 [Enterococcus wangshanyuanii]